MPVLAGRNVWGVSPTEYSVLVAIFRVRNWQLMPVVISRRDLCEWTGLTTQGVTNCLKSLRQKGLVLVTRRFDAPSMFDARPARLVWLKYVADLRTKEKLAQYERQGNEVTPVIPAREKDGFDRFLEEMKDE